MIIKPENIEEIKVQFLKIESVEELAVLLNRVYSLKYPKQSKNSRFNIEAKHLTYYAFIASERYRDFTIKKKSGGERPISSPRYKLKTIQKCINEVLNAVFKPHFTVKGFVPELSIVDNAKVHIDKQYVFNTDLKDFFPSTNFRRVKAVLGLAPFYLTDPIEQISDTVKAKITDNKGRGFLAYLIANLCCDNGSLPQGAPTSPTLTNIVCQRLDKNLFRYAKSINANYTRYADDITFSSHKPVFDESFKLKIKTIIEDQENFKINYEKERLQSKGQRQSVTGLIVNKKCNVDRKFIKDIRFWLMCWSKYGTEATQIKFLIQFPEKKGFLRYGGATPQFYSYLHGKILFLGMVRGKDDSLYVKFKNDFDILFTSISNNIQRPKLKLKFAKSSADLFEIMKTWELKGIEAAIKDYDN